jgi:hypothetical protein
VLAAAATVSLLRYTPLLVPLTLLLRPLPLVRELFFQQWERCGAGEKRERPPPRKQTQGESNIGS